MGMDYVTLGIVMSQTLADVTPLLGSDVMVGSEVLSYGGPFCP